MEFFRKKNVATYIVFPIQKNDGTFISSASGLDSEMTYWDDGNAPGAFADCTNEATEISAGMYYLSLTQAEMNHDYIALKIYSSSTSALLQIIEISTKPRQADVTLWDGSTLPTIPAAAPTAADIASQVRMELTAELGRIDAAITSRLAASGYTAPANSDLTTLLARLTEARAGYLDLLNSYLDAAISSRTTLGSGAIRWIYTLTYDDTGLPIADADVWVSTDEAGLNVIASGETNQNGQATFDLDAGTVYVWRAKSGCNFNNPDEETVS